MPPSSESFGSEPGSDSSAASLSSVLADSADFAAEDLADFVALAVADDLLLAFVDVFFAVAA